MPLSARSLAAAAMCAALVGGGGAEGQTPAERPRQHDSKSFALGYSHRLYYNQAADLCWIGLSHNIEGGDTSYVPRVHCEGNYI